MNCLECQDLLQDRLDGAAAGDRADLDRHLASCPDCRAWYAAARRLEEGLRFLGPPVPPAGLADQVVGRVLTERRTRRRRRGALYAAVALAASLLLVLAVGRWRPPAPERPPVADAVRSAPADRAPPESLPDSVAEAGSAVVGLTRRTADETVGQGRLLLPAVVARAERPDAGPPGPMDPPLRSLRTAGEGVSAGLEPVTSSARRAVDLFFHEIPALE